MLPVKRPRRGMGEDVSAKQRALLAELDLMKGEVEPIDVRRSATSRNETVTYRPTYRAVLANRGFLVRQTLGSGSYSKVKLAYHLEDEATRHKRAIKIVDRSRAPRDFQHRFLPREMKVWPKLQHPNITQMFELFEDKKRLYMVLEYSENGDVLRYIQKTGAIKESKAKNWFRQIAGAVCYLHDQEITHRDLKLENLLLDKDFNIKICDFGFVKEDSSKQLSRTYCGSKSYAAPEILQGQPYDPTKSDIWALGVILYIFVTGKMPFDESKGNHGVLDEQEKLNFPWHKFKQKFSSECRSMILNMFLYDYPDRPDIHAVLESPWVKEDGPEVDEPETEKEAPTPSERRQIKQRAEETG